MILFERVEKLISISLLVCPLYVKDGIDIDFRLEFFGNITKDRVEE
jgi:hypothetical protein